MMNEQPNIILNLAKKVTVAKIVAFLLSFLGLTFLARSIYTQMERETRYAKGVLMIITFRKIKSSKTLLTYFKNSDLLKPLKPVNNFCR